MSQGASGPAVLWVSRYLPYPLDTGGKVYSARLAASLAAAGAEIRFLGFGDARTVPPTPGVSCVGVPGRRRRRAAALWSTLPLAAAIDATRSYRTCLATELHRPWTAVVLDGYATGWALRDACGAQTRSGAPARIVYVSHNHEDAVWRDMAQGADVGSLERTVLRRNHRRVQALEQRLLQTVDLLTAITDADRDAMSPAGEPPAITLTPGYTRRSVAHADRTIGADTPRRVLLLGSFTWVVKQENLCRFVRAADPVFAAHGIQLDVVGDVPPAVREELRATAKATVFHGFLEDLAPILRDVRIGVVPDEIGGGFKLKYLDYVFGRLPVATLSSAADGVPAEVRAEFIEADDVPGLVAAVVAHLDGTDLLDARQRRAAAAAHDLFDWDDRGRRLLEAIRVPRPQLAPDSAPS